LARVVDSERDLLSVFGVDDEDAAPARPGADSPSPDTA
jgi:hypothetical protein